MKIQATNQVKLPAGAQERFQHLYDAYAYALAAQSSVMIERCGGALERFVAKHGIEGFRPAA